MIRLRLGCLLVAIIGLLANNNAYAGTMGAIDFNKLATAIYYAEGGSHTKHPYGILAKYRNTSPREACLNTIKHRYRDWLKTTRHKPYIAYLGQFYCPIGASNDPMGLNRNWVHNVTRLYDTM